MAGALRSDEQITFYLRKEFFAGLQLFDSLIIKNYKLDPGVPSYEPDASGVMY